jgi:membrane-bound metal-dependent hydrolase YbcI (DUF457 family)
MAQFAVHIATGIVCGKISDSEKEFKCGALLGAFLPDFDTLVMLMYYPANPEFARTLHRSATHSLLIPILLFLCACLTSCFPAIKKTSNFLRGLALGFFSHIFLDVLFWFDTLNILWPLTIGGNPIKVNLWSHVSPPVLLKSILGGVAEFLSYGVLFHWLEKFEFERETFVSRNMVLYKRLSYLAFGLFLGLVFILPEKRFAELAYGTASFVFAPLSLLMLWGTRNSLLHGTTGEPIMAWAAPTEMSSTSNRLDIDY